MTNDEIMEFQRRAREFRDTDLGRLFSVYEGKTARAWQVDTAAGYTENVFDKKLTIAWDEQTVAREALIEAMRKLVGLPA